MDKKIISVVLIFTILLSICLPVFANEGNSVYIEYRMKLTAWDANRLQSTLNKAFRNHSFYLIFQGEEKKISLSSSEAVNLKFGRTITKRIKVENLTDGQYTLYMKHGKNGKLSSIDFEVKNGQVVFERTWWGEIKNVLEPPLTLSDPVSGGVIGEPEKDASHYSLVDRDPDIVLIPEEEETESIWTDPDAGPETYWGNAYVNDGMFATLFADLVRTVMHSFWSLLGLHDPVTLIFGISPEVIYKRYSEQVMGDDAVEVPELKMDRSLYVSPEKGFLYMFNEKEYQMIHNVMVTLESVLKIPYAIGIAIVGLFILFKGFSAEERSAAKTLLVGILLYPMFIKFFPYLFEPLFWLNDTIVRAAGSVLTNPNFGLVDAHALTRPFVTILIGTGTSLNSLGVVLATFVLFVITSILNFQYFVRRFMLALLIMMFPFVAFLQIFPGTRQTFKLWWSEFTANLFLQAAHALVYVMFVSYVYHVKLPFVPIVAMLMTLSTLTTFVRNLMGCQPGSGVSGMISGMMGISAFMGAAKVAGGIVGGLGKTGRYSDEAPTGGGAPGGSIPGESTVPVPTGSGGGPAISSGGLIVPGPGGDFGGPSQGGTIGIPGGGTGGASSGVGAGYSGLLDKHGRPIPSSTASESSEASAAFGRSQVGDLSTTGPAWGLKPRMEPVNWKATLGRGTAATAITLGAMAGGIVGGAAMGPAGLGLGAYVATAGMKPIVQTGDRLVGVYNNYKAREEIIQDIMKRRNMERDKAAVFAATGIEADPHEIQYDDALREQYNNFMNVTGFGALGYLPEPQLKPEQVEDIRMKAKNERERFLEQNPSAHPVEINQHIMDNIIRKELEKVANNSTPQYFDKF